MWGVSDQRTFIFVVANDFIQAVFGCVAHNLQRCRADFAAKPQKFQVHEHFIAEILIKVLHQFQVSVVMKQRLQIGEGRIDAAGMEGGMVPGKFLPAVQLCWSLPPPCCR